MCALRGIFKGADKQEVSNKRSSNSRRHQYQIVFRMMSKYGFTLSEIEAIMPRIKSGLSSKRGLP